ncbi:MAG TPA: hypothetical protein VEL12_17475 [Candidatus Nitrosopolaris sp.]|nr:hypothetical protein [Candidatus Nitrosopolaris sp.]
MHIARTFIWVYPAMIIAIGVGFLVWSYFQAADADAYRRAPQCGDAVTPSCHELFAGVITSVDVSQTRSGERDDVVIKTEATGNLTATLEPSDSAAPHVRTGANVTVKRYQGKVTLVTVDGFGVASTANPTATQSDTVRYGWLFTGLGVLSGGFVLYSRRRRSGRAVSAEIDVIGGGVMGQQEILPSGTLGWSVSPRPKLSVIGRYAFGFVLLIVLTLRVAFDPSKTPWVVALDSAAALAAVVTLLLFYRNARVFADDEQVGKVNLLGRTKSQPLRDIQRAERFSVSNRYGAVKHLVFVGADGRKAFEVAGYAWDFDRLDAFCREAGIHLGGSYEDVVSAFRLNSRVPGSTKWSQQLLLGGGLVVVILVLVVLLVGGPTQR